MKAHHDKIHSLGRPNFNISFLLLFDYNLLKTFYCFAVFIQFDWILFDKLTLKVIVLVVEYRKHDPYHQFPSHI